jgi:hypothetical protein
MRGAWLLRREFCETEIWAASQKRNGMSSSKKGFVRFLIDLFAEVVETSLAIMNYECI